MCPPRRAQIVADWPAQLPLPPHSPLAQVQGCHQGTALLLAVGCPLPRPLLPPPSSQAQRQLPTMLATRQASAAGLVPV